MFSFIGRKRYLGLDLYDYFLCTNETDFFVIAFGICLFTYFNFFPKISAKNFLLLSKDFSIGFHKKDFQISIEDLYLLKMSTKYLSLGFEFT